MEQLGTLVELGGGAYAYEQPDGGWCLNNAGLVVGSERTLLIDTAATERRTQALAVALRTVAPAGVDYVVNTHFHGDHTFGNHHFQPRATIISHRQCAAEQLEAGEGLRGLWPDVEWGSTPVVGPDLTYEGELALDLGDVTAVLTHPESAHTNGDTVVWLPESGILYTGDIAWSGTTPFCLMGSVAGSLKAVESLRAKAPRVVVPGHGPVGGPEILDQTERYLQWILDLAQKGLQAGRSASETASTTDIGEFAGLIDSERLVGNLHRAYADLQGHTLDGPGQMQAFSDMITLNGGLPSCHA